MTIIATGLNTVHRACMASCQGGLYYTNNFDPIKVWYGVTAALQNAGITGPVAAPGAPGVGAGGFSNGDHEIRFRYQNSKTGYVSNPSPARVQTIAGGNGVLTFNVPAQIPLSTDPKVDTILIEATAIGGGTFYQAGTGPNIAGNIIVGLNDAALQQQFNSDAAYGSSDDLETYSSEVPPLCAIVIPYRGRMWYLGDQAYPLTGVTFTNGSATVTGTGFNLRWAGRTITREGDTATYVIAAVASTVSMTLTVVYGGVTGVGNAIVVSQFPNRGYYSRLFYPEQTLQSRWARDFLAERSDQIRGAFGRKDGLYVLGLFSGERLIFNADPSAAEGAVISPLQGRRGCFNQRCLVDIEGDVYAADRQGIWVVGEKPLHLSTAIDRLLRQYVDFDEAHQFHLNWEPINRVLKFFFVANGDTTPKMRACMDLETGKWFFETSFQGITASAVVATEDGLVRLMLGDENGYSWYDGIENAFDGTPPACPGVVTVDDGATNAVIPVTEILPTTPPTMEGVIVLDPTTSEYDFVISNTATTFTLNTGFSSAPTIARELYVGPIAFDYRTKWWVDEDQATRKNAIFLIVKTFPGSETGTFRVYFFADFSTTPAPFTSFVSGTMPEGVSVPPYGQPYLECSLSGGEDHRGVLAIPVPVSWNDAIQARVTSLRPDGALRLLDIAFSRSDSGIASDAG